MRYQKLAFRRKQDFLSLGLLLFGLISRSADASLISLPVLDPSQIGPIFDVLASTVVFRSLEPPSHPKVFGLWANIRTNITSAEAISSFTQLSQSNIPFGNIQAGVNIPFGLGLELGYLPLPSFSGTTFSSCGLGLKWNVTSVFYSKLPFDFALRTTYSSAKMSYEQSIEGDSVNVDYSTKIYGGTLMLSKVLLFLEPYFAYGFVHHSSTLSGSGSVSIFNNNFPALTGQVADGKTSSWLQAGVELKLLMLAIGFQYDRVFNTSTSSFKVGLKF